MGTVLSRLLLGSIDGQSQQNMSALPNELLLNILTNVSTNDLNRARLVDRRLSRVANSVRNTRAKPRFTLTISSHADNDTLSIRLQRRWRSGGVTEELSTFDMEAFHLMDIDVIEIEGLTERTGSENSIRFLNLAAELSSSLNTVSELRLTNVLFPDSAKAELLKFFKAIVPQCTHVFVRDCLLPVAIPADTIAISNRLRTFKWSHSLAAEGEQEMSEEVIRLVSLKLNLQCTTVELSEAACSSIVGLFQQWMTMAQPTLFSLSLLNRSSEWQSQLLAVCTRAGYRNYQGEFEHPGAGCAHIKVLTGLDSCQLLPVLDVPAKTREMPVVMARWFRDR
ncbi:hypothetical protein PENTCL1PPCAC_30067 [Pristionchus entomophagus]|uniref:F-box domain-containing protein n=1 Tax=Pristionchus entomophagus TaxID=358040 RepID=A0AAV5UML0_9BILA|nr:hypothetical protein PENTCL1PPCAC_30067 [Pristionchus entomophagus]